MRVLFTVCLVLLSQGCAYNPYVQPKSNEKTYPEDSWYKKVPSGLKPWEWAELDNSNIYEVAKMMQSKSEYTLQSQAAVQLSPAQFQEFTGKQLVSRQLQHTKPFLVRALYINKMPMGFSVRYRGTQLWIHHNSVGQTSRPMKRQSLVLLLGIQPSEVFVTCSIAG